MADIDIRLAQKNDIAAITDIYNDIIETSTAVYSDEKVTPQNRLEWFLDRQADQFPTYVALLDGQVVGFASYGKFRGGFYGYRKTVEHSIHVATSCRGVGVGSRLMQALISHAKAQGLHVMIGAVDADNEKSIGFHQKHGFTKAAILEEVGTKFGRWLDLQFMHLKL